MFKSKSFTLVKEKFKYTELRWAKYFVIPGLAAFILLLVLSNVKHPDHYKENMDIHLNDYREANNQELECGRRNCQILCSDGDLTQLTERLTKLALDCTEIEIDFFRCGLPGRKLRKGWIKGTIKIKSLRFTSCALNDIEADAFDDPVLSSVIKLELNGIQLQTISNSTLKGLNALQELVVVSTLPDFTPKENFLKELKSILLRLSISASKSMASRNPKNLLGTEELSLVEEVDLSNNSFGDAIDKDSFAVLKGVKKLYLRRCNITALKSDVFHSIKDTIILIDLRWNALITLSKDFFDWFKNSPLNSILLTNNPWNCSCSLLPFSDFYRQNPRYFEPSITCNTRKNFALLNLRQPSLCRALTNEVTSPPSTETTLPPTQDPHAPAVRLHCDERNKKDYLDVQPADIQFSITSISPTGVKIDVTTFDGDYSIVWFFKASKKYRLMEINYDEYGLGCNARVRRVLVLENLKQHKSYVFCLIKVGDVDISPFNCHSHYMFDGSTVAKKDWLLWGSQTATCAFITVGILVSVFVGAIFTFAVLNRKAARLKTAVIDENNLNSIVFPRDRSTSRSQTDITTQVSQRPRILLRSISEKSGLSEKSYVLPTNIYEVIQYQQRSDATSTNFYFGDGIPSHSPPPIPKPKISTTTTAELYSSCKRY